MKKSNFNIAIIGAGKIASSLTAALKRNHSIDIVVSRNLNSARLLAKRNSIQRYSDDIQDISPASNMFLLTVPDDQIKIVAQQISKLKINFNKKYFIHFSGSESSELLKSIKLKGGKTGSLHIMQTFSSKRVVDLKNCYSAVEADDVNLKDRIFTVAKSIKLKPFEIKSENKIAYHLSGVFASNFLIGNYFTAQKIYIPGDKRLDLYDILNPIIEKTLNNISQAGTVETLSGPVERGDINTVQNHLRELKSKQFIRLNKKIAALVLHSYIVQSLILLQIDEAKFGKLNSKHKKIQKLLNNELKHINF